MIQRLKEETRELHEQVEGQNLAKLIMNHSMDLETYKLLLLQNFIAYRATETEIKKHLPQFKGEKHQQLALDLSPLKISSEIPSENDIFECRSTAEALGAAYVVEGSALGGMVIAKHIPSCDGLKDIDPPHFFSGSKSNLEDWKNFKITLEQYPFTEIEKVQAISKAKETFLFFERVFNRELALG
ncbi:biliverdin-producing heme oxygenase [Salinimicrobium oceani]|nr:biliverdin-producing heme oxygenase [Salinimicrobium oceani]